MVPFREKPVKWKKKDGYTGRYKNVNGFKFDIIKQTIVIQPETMSKYFLADTPEEAEVLYNRYSSLLNALAYNYAIATGLQKDDLFSEALIGLGRAYRDWDINRSDDFKMYAIFRIKDALNEFTRSNTASVTVPSYIKKSHNHITELKTIFAKYNISIHDKCISTKMEISDKHRSIYLISKLKNAADRAKVDYRKFIERVEYIPRDHAFDEDTIPNNDKRSLETALIIKKLQTYMNETELTICKGIMEGLSYEIIGQKFNKNSVWVRRILDKLRDRILASWS